MTQLTDFMTLLNSQLQPALVTAAEIDALAAPATRTTFAQQIESVIAQVQVPTAPGITYVNGMSQPDTRGLVKLQAMEAWRASDPKAANIPAFWAIQDILTEPTFNLTPAQAFNVSSNIANARFQMGVMGYPAWNAGPCWYNYAMTQVPGKLYNIGAQQTDALSFRGDLVVGTKVYFIGTHIALDLANVIASWKAHNFYPSAAIQNATSPSPVPGK